MTGAIIKPLAVFCYRELDSKAKRKLNTEMIHFMWEAKTFNSVGRHFAVMCFNFIVVLTLYIKDYYHQKALETGLRLQVFRGLVKRELIFYSFVDM